jgi:hypothetical protein
MSKIKKTGLELLREPFEARLISKLPKGTKAQNECDYSEKRSCNICGGFHHPKISHLDYVGHAALTDRLLDCDINWNWEPLSLGSDGYPVIDKNGGMWIKLTVCGVTRLGYGDAQGKTGGNAIKEAIGDAIRNAAMRGGGALDLWFKGDLHEENEQKQTPEIKHPLDAPAYDLPIPERMDELKEIAAEIVDFYTKGFFDDAFVVFDNISDNSERNELWKILKPNSAVRTKLTEIGKLKAGKYLKKLTKDNEISYDPIAVQEVV